MPDSLPEDTCRFLEWDSRFFGMKIGRVNTSRLDRATIRSVQSWCHQHRIECLYFLADAGHGETHQIASQFQFNLVDIRVTLENSALASAAANPVGILAPITSDPGSEPSSRVTIQSFKPANLPALREMAGRLHQETRFFSDPGFPRERSEELYRVWLERSCQNPQGRVFVAAMEGTPVGYLGCSVRGGGGGQIELMGVETTARGQGVGGALVADALGWLADQGCSRATVVTQGRNVRAQRLYQRCGFLTDSVLLWYHLWRK